MRVKLIRKAGEGANKSYTFTWWDNEPTAERRPTTPADLKNCLHKETFSAADDAEALKLAVEYLCDYVGADPEDVADTPEEIWDYFNKDWGAGDPIPMVLKQRSRVVKDSGFNPNDEDEDESKKTEGHDGWDDWEEVEGLEDAIDGIENLAYELRHCIRGAKTHCKDWKALAHYIKGLAANLDDAAELMAYKHDDADESKKTAYREDATPVEDVAKSLEREIDAKFCRQIVGAFTRDGNYPGVSVGLASDDILKQADIENVEGLVEEYNKAAETQLGAKKFRGESLFGTNATTWDNLVSKKNPDGMALTVYVNLNAVPKENAEKASLNFVKLVGACLKKIGKGAAEHRNRH